MRDLKVPITPYPLSGQWQEGVTWNFVPSLVLPSPDFCASVGCLLINEAGIVLTRTGRGYWELPGGHIEPGEDLIAALKREAKEEGGLEVTWHAVFGATEVHCKPGVINPSTKEPYPRLGYIPHFVAFGAGATVPDGHEVLGVKTVPFERLDELLSLEVPEFGILQLGLLSFSKLPQCSDHRRKKIEEFLKISGLNTNGTDAYG